MAAEDSLTTFYRGDSIFQSATFNPKEHTAVFPHHYENLFYFLTVIQYFQVNIIPVTWQPALDRLGRGTSAVVNQSMIHASLNYAFKRTGLDTPYSTLISEVAILSLPQIRGHANINGLEGICWELRVKDSNMGPAVRPVLVSSKADFGDLRRFLKSELGMNLSLRQKLDICLDIARAMNELHQCGVVHGDLKPENCLVFRGENTDEVVAKVSDFGFSSIWARHEDLIQVAMSRPWNAPEWHHRGFIFCEARKMDVYSFGLLCLWIVMQSRDVETPLEDIKALLFTAEGEFQIDVLDKFKSEGNLVELLTQTILQKGPIKVLEHSMLLEVFQRTLKADPRTRDSGLCGAFAALDGGVQSDSKHVEDIVLSSLLPAHAQIDLTDSYLLGQIAYSAIELRSYLVTDLLTIWNGDPQFSCSDCRRQSAFQLAFHYLTGFGVARDVILSERWCNKSNSTTDLLHSLMAKMQCWSFNEEIYRPGTFEKLSGQGIVDMQGSVHELRWSYDPEKRAKIDESITLEARDIECSMGSTNHITCIIKEMAAWNLNERGDYLKALNLRSEVHHVLFPSASEDNLNPLPVANRLAITLAELGRLDEASDICEKAVGIYMRRLGKDHSRTWAGMSTLSFVRILQGRYEESLKIYLGIVGSMEMLWGRDHPILCHFILNISGAYYYQGLLPDAERFARDAIARCARSLEVSHIDTVKAKAQLARVFMDLGRLPESEALHDEVIHYYSTTIGAEHPTTLMEIGERAMVCILDKRPQEAEAALTACLNVASRKLGPSHPDSLALASALSSALTDQLRFRKALEIETQLYPRMKVVKGPAHPQTLVVMTNLAHTYRGCGLLKESEELELKILEAKSNSLGHDHPQTIMTKGRLAKLYEEQSRLAKGECLYREILDARERIAGLGDIFTLRAKSDLSRLLEKKGDFEEASDLIKQVLEGREKIYHPSHRLIFQALYSIASIQNSRSHFKEEEMTRIHILDRSISYAGNDHPQTLHAIQQMAKFHTERRDWPKAERYLNEEVALFRRLESEDKSGLLMALANLAVTKGYQGQWSIAAELMQDVFDGKVDTLGKDHMHSVEAREMLDHLKSQTRSENNESVRQIEWQILMKTKKM